jgi:hypothetical protein
MQRKPTKYSFTHLRFIAAQFIASRIGDDHKIAKSTLRALEAMVYQDLEVSKSCTMLLKAYGFTNSLKQPTGFDLEVSSDDCA